MRLCAGPGHAQCAGPCGKYARACRDGLKMRWRGERESENIEDRRDEGGGFGFPMPGGGMRFPGGGAGHGGGIGIFGILIILGLMFFFGIDPRVILQGGPPGGDESGIPDIHLPQSRPDQTNFPMPQQGPQIQRPQSTSEDDLRKFVAVVLADTEDVWGSLFTQYGATYSDPRKLIPAATTLTSKTITLPISGVNHIMRKG